jgi:nucleoside-diphosphate-sugar epimerase
MRIFVTGASGFIGTPTIRTAAEKGHSVTALCSRAGCPADISGIPGVHWVAADLRDVDSLSKQLSGHDAFIHLAGRYPLWGRHSEALDFVESNTLTTALTLEACRRAGVNRYVYASTAQVYGRPERIPVQESDRLKGTTVYASSKSAAESLVQAYASSYGLLGFNLRLFNVYGPGQPSANIVATIVAQALCPGVVTINSGDPERDFVYVEDVVSALLAAVRCEGAHGQSVNIASGSGITIMDLGRRIMTIAGRTDAIVTRVPSHTATAADPDRLVADVTLAERLLGWRPATTLDEGLALTVRWHSRSLAAKVEQRVTI